MWLTEHSQALAAHPGPIVFACDLSYGVPYLIVNLALHPRWIELTSTDFNDAIALGDKLAEACQSLGLKIHALPYHYGLAMLKAQLAQVAPQTFVITNADHYPEFAQDIFALHEQGHKILLHTNDLSYFDFPVNTLVVTADTLRLTEAQAHELAAKRIPPSHVVSLWKKTNGVHDLFVAELCKRLHIPAPLSVGPSGPKLPDALTHPKAASEHLALLVKHQRWIEALELTLRYLPERTSEILTQAGHVFHERGLHQRLEKLLSELPPEVQADETILYWQLMANFRLGRETTMESKVVAFLSHHEAPQLRTLYAGVLAPYEQALAEATRAHQAQPSPFTYFQMGLKTEDIGESIQFFEESVKVAEQHGRGYEVVRNAGALAERLIFAGRFKEAANWSKWALTEFDKREVKDNVRRLHVLNVWAYASILHGDLVGLEPLLTEGISHLELAYPELARLYRATLGSFLIASRRPCEALKQYQSNLEYSHHRDMGIATFHMTRAYLELGMNDEARDISRRAVDLMNIEQPVFSGHAHLAYGMALSVAEPEVALSYLGKAHEAFSSPYTAHYLLQTVFYQAMIYLRLGKRQKAREVLSSVDKPLHELGASGLKLLTGPDDLFHNLMGLIRGDGASQLEFRLLGEGEVWMFGEKLETPPLWLEILTVLVLKNRPVSLEELLACLYGDDGKKDNLKTSLSKMRRVLPISQHPYHITQPYRADVSELKEALQKGDVTGATKLYQKSLLPFSESPFIRQHDDVLAETLRQTALRSNETEVLLELAERYEDDPDLLERLSTLVPLSDPRTPMIEARLKQAQKAMFAN
jgi:tetratricopeptide (TPR) repeat protein